MSAPALEVRGPHPVDQVPPLARLAPLGLQHVLAMYAGAVAVPLIVGGAMISAGGMAPGDLPHLVVADLFVAGLATVLQSVGFWRFGVRLPLMQGCTFAAVGPMITIGATHGVTAIYGSVIACGVFMMVVAPAFSTLLRFFPPLVTGTVILLIGLSLMSVAAGWVGGGTGTPGFGAPSNLLLALFTLVAVLLLERLAPPAVARVAILLGIAAGALVAALAGELDLSGVRAQAWVGVPRPFAFGAPTFEIGSVVAMCVVALVIMTETTGDILAIGEIVDRPVSRRAIADGMRADGLSTVLGGVFTTFPYTAFAQNVGLVSLSGVRSRYVATFAGGVLVVLGLLPKAGAVVAAVPVAVLGGAGVALFGMVAASGIRTLASCRLDSRALLMIATAIGVGLLPTVNPAIYAQTPSWFQTVFDSGISSGALTAIVLHQVLCTSRHTPAENAAAAAEAAGVVPLPARRS